MSEKQIKTRIIHKHDIEANWAKAENFIPKQGEFIVYDIDATHEHERFKIGDGKSFVNELPFVSSDNIQPDWEQADETAKDYIKNKPSVATDDEVMALLSTRNIVTPVSDSTGYTYLDIDSKILTL